MIFTRVNASVVEFPWRPHIDSCYGHLAVSLGLDYWIVPQLSAYQMKNYTATPNNVDVIVRLIGTLLDQKGLGHLKRSNSSRPAATRADEQVITSPENGSAVVASTSKNEDALDMVSSVSGVLFIRLVGDLIGMYAAVSVHQRRRTPH